MQHKLICSLVLMAVVATPAVGSDFASRAQLRMQFAVPQDDPADASDAADPDALDGFSEVVQFGDAGTRRLYIHGGYGQNNSKNEFLIAGLGLEFFLLDELSISTEFNGMLFDQGGDDAEGFNFNLLFRWHFYRERNWSLFLDAGAGLLVTTHDVPDNGSSFNFTPQAGGGATISLNDDLRIIVGLRWHHISNANLYSNNPGRDSFEIYGGVSMPF